MVGIVVSHKAHTHLKGQPLFSFNYVTMQELVLTVARSFLFQEKPKVSMNSSTYKMLPVNSILKHSSGQLKYFRRRYLP